MSLARLRRPMKAAFQATLLIVSYTTTWNTIAVRVWLQGACAAVG